MDLHGIRAAARRARHAAAERLGAAAPAHDVLLGALADLDIRYKITPEGSVLAANVAGRLYRRARAIRVAERLTPDERTFVGAHELGHYVLHPDEFLEFRLASTLAGTAATSLRAFEAIGYSERERIEAEADAFAAEFACPSGWLRDQIVGLGCRPSAIAADLGLPVTVVTGQAVHAVLLPSPEPHALRHRPAFDLDAPQAAAAAWPDHALLLEGGPGTGKTAAAAARIAWLASARAAAGFILALTSSAATAADLRSRLGHERSATARPWIGTAAELGFEIIAKNAHLLGLTDRFRLLDETGALALFEACLPTGLGPKPIDALRAVFRAKERLVTAGDWTAAANAQAAGARSKAAKNEAAAAQDVGTAYARYEAALARADKIDAADLAAMPVRLLRKDAGALAALRRRFCHLVIDDVHDLGPAAVELVELLAGPDATVWATGDAAQCVMRFRGASPATLERFTLRFGAQRGRLDRDHRALPRVERFAASLAQRRQMPASNDFSANAEAKKVRDDVEACRAQGMAYGEQAILARTHGALKRVVAGLEDLGVPVAMTPDLIHQDSVRDLLAIAQLLAEGAPEAFLRVARLAEYRTSERDAATAMAWAKTRRGPLPRGLSLRGASALRRLAADLEGLDAMPASTAITIWLFERSGYLARRLTEHPGPRFRRSLAAVHHLIRIAEEHAAQGDANHGRLVARVKRAGSVNQDTAYKQVLATDGRDSVQAMTIHAARGLEFDAVHLIGLSQRQARSGRRPSALAPVALGISEADQAESEAALLLVATSRARKRIHAT